MKYFVELAYKGTHYHGWQRQPRHKSVQQVLEEAFTQMTGKKINCIGCGRTDAGVHASQYYCHIKVQDPFEFDPVFRLNKILPEDISIFRLIPVPAQAHAQHDAISRTYTYRIHTQKNAFLHELSAFYSSENLDIEVMKKGLELLLLYQDYRSFCLQPNVYKSTECQIMEASLDKETTGNQLTIRLTANRFLKGMVRILVRNLLETGYGRLSLNTFEDCLQHGKKPVHSRSAHPQGLYLSGVKYPYSL